MDATKWAARGGLKDQNWRLRSRWYGRAVMAPFAVVARAPQVCASVSVGSSAAILRHPVGSKACEQSGDKCVARAGGVHADNGLGAEMGKLLLKGGKYAGFALGHQQQFRLIAFGHAGDSVG